MRTIREILALALVLLSAQLMVAYEPTADECRGSLSPYSSGHSIVAAPDTLRPIYLSHVGRHGSRYPASGSYARRVAAWLEKADSSRQLTQAGQRLLATVREVLRLSDGRWGALDSIGFAEHRAIADRMARRCPELFADGRSVVLLASYSPRATLSMYTAAEELQRHAPGLRITLLEDSASNALMRFFDTDTAFIAYHKQGEWRPLYRDFYERVCPTSPARRWVGRAMKLSDEQARELSLWAYYVVAGLDAMGLECHWDRYFTTTELSGLWQCFNYRQYLQRSASVAGSQPIEAARPLLQSIITEADAVLRGDREVTATLRYGHGETLMPLVGLMALRGCYYLTYYDDTVVDNWRDSYISPMAANLQLTFYRSPSGRIYVRGDLNEQPVPLIRGTDSLYVEWPRLRAYLLNFLL